MKMRRSRQGAVLFIALLFSFLAGICAPAQAAKMNKKEEDAFYVAVKSYEDGFYDVSLTLLDRFLKTYIDSEKKIEALIYTGQCYFFQEKYIKALDQFESLLKMDEARPFKDKVLFWLGEVYAKGRDYRQAAEFYKDLVENHKDSYYYLSAYKALAQVQFSEGKFDEALQTYRRILLTSGDEAAAEEAFFGVCDALYRLKKYDELKKELSDFLIRYPQSSMLNRVYFYLGEAAFYLGQYDEALDAYRKAEASADDEEQSSLSRLGLGWTYLKLKKYGDAKEVFSKFSDEDAAVSVVLGKAVMEAGLSQHEKALQLFDRVIALDKTGAYVPFAHYGQAEVLYSLERFPDAIVSYRTALDKLKAASGMYTDARELRDKIYYGMAWSYLKVGDFRSAQEAFEKVALLSTDKVVKLSALVQLADTYQDSGDYKKAIESYQKFLSDYPDTVYNDYIQYQLGMTWLKLERVESAVLCFRKLTKDYPSSQLIDDARYFLGLAYFRKGDFDAARQELEVFLASFKDSSYRLSALFLLGESLMNLAQHKPALDALQIVVKEASMQDPLRQKAEYEIANVYSQMGHEAEAKKRLSDFIARYPDSQLAPDILLWLGQSYAAKRDFSTSRKYLERLVRTYPDQELASEAYIEVGMTYWQEGNGTMALRNFQQSREKGSGSVLARSLVLSGDVFLSRGELDAALKNYQEAAAVGGAVAKASHIKMADVYEKKRSTQEAIAVLEQALSLEGPQSNSEIQFRIAQLWEESGSAQEALEAYLQVVYLYPEEERLVVKALLRVARIYENREDRENLAAILKKVATYNVPEARYAEEKLQGLKQD